MSTVGLGLCVAKTQMALIESFAMKKTGRPNGRPRLPEGEGKSYPIQVRLSKKERELVKIVAETYGIPVSSWARIVILKAANKRLSPRA